MQTKQALICFHMERYPMKIKFSTANNKYLIWLKRIGIIGVLFFLLKGIAWLAIGFYVFS
jgi:hypothetical protein